MLGGGTFTSQNKVLPGAYINVISKAQPTALLGERGIVALPMALSWGSAGEVITVTAEAFQRNSDSVVGYSIMADELKNLREVFKNAQKVHIYNLADGEGSTTATLSGDSLIATAKKAGSRGNALKMVVQANIDNDSAVDVSVYLDSSCVFEQKSITSSDKINANDFFVMASGVTAATLLSSVGAGKSFSGGADGVVTTQSHQNALNAFERYNYNVLVCTDSETVGDLYVEYTKRMRDEIGKKFQTVVVNKDANYEGIVNLIPAQKDAVYWVAGALAGCAVNKSCTNKKYDGEYVIPCRETQSELENCIADGKFAFHMVEDEVRVLTDINSLIEFTPEKGEVFSKNQVIRVADQCANDTAKIFNNEFLGKIQNDKSGRVSFWNRIVSHRRELQTMRAIDTYAVDELTVDQGESRDSVVVNEAIVPIVAMEKLYMTIIID